jgi:WD40 repeat protein
MKKILSAIILIILPLSSIKSQKPIYSFGNNHVPTSAISFAKDGRLMLIGGYAKVYDLQSGKEYFRTVHKDEETYMDYAFDAIISPDDQSFLLAKINRIEIWDIQRRKTYKIIRDKRLVPTAVTFSRDAGNIIYMRKNGELVFLNCRNWNETVENKIDATPVTVSLSPDGNKLLIGTKESEIFSYDLKNHNLGSTKTESKETDQILFSHYNDYVAASFSDGTVSLFKFPSMDHVNTWSAHSPGQTVISFHPSGNYLASGGKDKMIRVWNIPDGSLVSEWKAHEDPLASLAFTPSGTQLASGCLNKVLSINVEDTKVWAFSDQSKNNYSLNISDEPINPVNSTPVLSDSNNSTQKRIALLIGNGTYLNSSLANPENDAREFKNALLQFGFEVLEFENLNQSQMKKAIDEFGQKLKNYDVGLFYYAGHGIQSKGYNYLIPVDASLSSELQVEYDCVQADRVLGVMEASGTKVNILILDACRNNPFERSWTRAVSGKGLAYMNAPSGTLIAYATAPGSTASDGSGKNGLYTSAILESIKIPNITILQMFQNVRSIVSQKSNKLQIPWESTSLTGDFYFYQVAR